MRIARHGIGIRLGENAGGDQAFARAGLPADDVGGGMRFAGFGVRPDERPDLRIEDAVGFRRVKGLLRHGCRRIARRFVRPLEIDLGDVFVFDRQCGRQHGELFFDVGGIAHAVFHVVNRLDGAFAQFSQAQQIQLSFP